MGEGKVDDELRHTLKATLKFLRFNFLFDSCKLRLTAAIGAVAPLFPFIYFFRKISAVQTAPMSPNRRNRTTLSRLPGLGRQLAYLIGLPQLVALSFEDIA